MNERLKEVFGGKVVNKDHTINKGVDEFPRYVLEYLIKITTAPRKHFTRTIT
jgi:ATP-dependent Lon protease